MLKRPRPGCQVSRVIVSTDILQGVAREYKMVKRRDQVEETRRRIAKATYELHSTVGPALTTIAMVSERAGVPRQTVYRNFGTQVELFRSCIAFGLEIHPLPDPTPRQPINAA